MEEIEILPRDSYLHTVNVTQTPCIIQWWFSTKRKNIDFGLFYRKPLPPDTDDTKSTGGTLTASMRKLAISSPASTRQLVDNDVASRASPTPTTRSPSEMQARQRAGYFKLKDKNVTELIPLKHYESSRSTIKDSWTADKTGAYVLYFDNSFSKNTSKRLYLCVAVKEKPQMKSDKPPAILTGWLLKKKRKRMQGWAKRWFTIQGRSLMYSTAENSVVRGKIDIVNAAISISKDDRAIIVDGDEGFMQLRALTNADFKEWASVLQSVKEKAALPHSSGATLSPDASGSQITPYLFASPACSSRIEITPPPPLGSSQPANNLERAQKDFEMSFDELTALMATKDTVSRDELSARFKACLSKLQDSESIVYALAASYSGQLSAPGTSRSGTNTTPPSIAHTGSRNSCISNSGSDVFYDTSDVFEIDNGAQQRSASGSESASPEPSSISHTPNTQSSDQRLQSASPSSQNYDLDSLSDSDEDEDDYEFDDANQTPISHKQSRMQRDLIRDPDFLEAVAEHSISSPRPSISESPSSGSRLQALSSIRNIKQPENNPDMWFDYISKKLESYIPRTTLPAETCKASVSLISILRKNVGKDLSSIAMPLVMNEPINTLQALCEEMLYSKLLEKANEMDDSLDRLMLVAAFAISTLSSKKLRTERKPFNPMLGETYELIDPHLKIRFISEKVSHHPPIMACYSDSPSYRFWQDSCGKSKFWGKSIELIQTSNVNIQLLKHEDHFTFCKPSALMRGLITGNRSVDFIGAMNIVNHKTGDRCKVHFKEGGMFSSANDLVECHLYRGPKSTKVERVLRGSWPSILKYEKSATHSDTIWEAAALPHDASKYYGFGYFTMQLNELPPSIVDDLPQTDTRLRPDQRAYEEGRIDDAEHIKHNLEEAQRARKRDRDEKGEEWVPQWFEERGDPYSQSGTSWQYCGGYWEAKATHSFKPRAKLW